MIRLSAVVSSFCILVLIWHECGENPGLFCYRISHGFFKSARNRALVAVPVTAAVHLPMTQRTHAECLTRSSTFSVRSIIPRD
jgi:hypothetical protein